MTSARIKQSILQKFNVDIYLGGYHFLPNRGGHEKAGGSQNFFMRNRGVTEKIKRFLYGYKF